VDRAHLGRLLNTDRQSVRPAELHSAELNDPRIEYPRGAQALKPVFRRLVPAMLLVAGILICCPTLSFGQSRTVRLNENAFAYAEELIAQGRVVVDKKNAWTDHRPGAAEENEFIRTHDFAEYAKWHLGIDETHAGGTKAGYKFPFGDFKNVHRCGLLAVKSRAHQFGYADIEKAAIRLIEIIHSKEENESRRVRGKVVGPGETQTCSLSAQRSYTPLKRTHHVSGGLRS